MLMLYRMVYDHAPRTRWKKIIFLTEIQLRRRLLLGVDAFHIWRGNIHMLIEVRLPDRKPRGIPLTLRNCAHTSTRNI